MATLLYNAYVYVNSIDMSTYVRSIELPFDRDSHDVTTMGCDTKISLAGLKDNKVRVTFLQNFTVTTVDDRLWTMYDAGTGYEMIVRPDSGAVSTSNPQWTMTVWLKNYTGISGAVGSVPETVAEFELSTGNVERTTA